MQPILLDISRLLWRAWRRQLPTGIDRACLAYVQHYRGDALAVVQRGGFTRVLGKRTSQEIFDLLLLGSATMRRDLLRLIPRALAENSPRAKTLKGALYLNIGHTGLNQPGHGRWVERSGVKAIYYVHDLIPITHPQYARESEPERHAARMHTVLRHGAGVIANSEDSLMQLRLFAQNEKLPVPASLCAPLGADAALQKSATTSLNAEPYFVILGTIEGRKNHLLLLDVWRNMIRSGAENIPKLIIIGQRGWSAGPILDALDNDEMLRPYIVELGRCSDDDLQSWLAHARALLFPTFVEGQGLPLIEALASGTPVIASDLTVFRETGGEIAEYLDPHDAQGWTAAVQDYMRDDSLRRVAQCARMEGFVPQSWEKHLATVDNWLQRFTRAG